LVSHHNPNEAKARLAWDRLLDLLFKNKERFVAELSKFELNPAQAHLLRALLPEQPTPMCRLAECLGCDASNVTNLVDRLETRGLIERLADPADRRIKNIALTADGARLREQVLSRAFAPPEALTSLPEEHLNSLVTCLTYLDEAGSREADC
jgi:MarR family transcriptional regulator, organic hydroperoxide resistance regulator